MDLKDTIQFKTGRINRRQYLLCLIITSFAIIASEIVDPLFGNEIFSILVTAFFGAYLFVVFSVKRVRDIGYSGWYAVALIIAYLTLVALGTIIEIFNIGAALLSIGFVLLLIWAGDENTNQYGEPPEGWSF